MTTPKTLSLHLQLEFRQLLEVVRQLPRHEQLQLMAFLKEKISEPDTVQTHLASEAVLAKDWLTPEEDEAWQNL